MKKNIQRKKRRLDVGLAIILSFLGFVGKAQYLSSPPTIDGTADAGYLTSGPWSLAWDENYLYVRYLGGGATEPAIFNIDVDPQVPVSGGSNSNGSLVGQTNWGITPTLPFRADYMIYWESQYAEYRTDNGAGGWSATTVITTSDRSNITSADREIRLSWTSMGLSGRPTSFNWFGFANSRATPGFIFNQTPGNNPSGFNATPKINYYYTVSNTSNSGTTNPFSRISFEHREAYDIYITGNTTLYDITNNANNVSDQIIIENNSSLVTVQIDGTANLYGGIIVSGADVLQYNSGAVCRINGNGYTSTQNGGSITYNQTNSTLIYNSGSAYTFGNEWPSTNSPVTITLSNGTTLIITASRTINASGSMTVNSGCAISVSSGQTLTTNGRLTLKSNATGTASIGNSAGSILGNVTVERFVAGQLVRGRWRFLSSPVQGQKISNWMTQFYVTGPGDGTTLGAANTNGWHTNQANISFPNSTFGSDPRSVKTTSIRTYTESISGNLDLGWTNLTGTAQDLLTGQGFRAYIRGPISGGTSQLGPNANSNLQGEVILSLTGTVNSGNVTMPISATATGASSTFDAANDGWNLLGNPYPCAYDFNAYHAAGRIGGTSGTSGTSYTNINPVVHVFDAGANGYKSYNAASGGTLSNGIIPSGASFFIQASNTGASMTFTEAFKITSSAPIAVHKGAKTDEFTIKYSKDSTENDEFMLKMITGSTLNKELYDISKLRNENLNLSSYGEDTLQLTLSSIPLVDGETRIKLNVEATQVGTYKFEFKNMDNFDAGVSVSLFDKYTNKTTDVKANTLYTFEMGPNENQWGKNRFELILNGKATTGVNDNNGGSSSITSTNLSIYPNPATDVLNINISNANFKNSEVVVYNISGMEVLKTNMAANNAQLNIESLSNGVYFVKVTNQNGFNKTVKFVK